ncbi:MAG: HD domain-containing protein [Acidobacteria bacterium]|nr:HD domain-containing protein [Acidobacteriota bacterium]
MPKKISLILFVVVTLLAVGLIPLVLTGWFLSDKSGRELRASENRYQIQLVQDKARQIEMFGKRFASVVSGLAMALELSNNTAVISSAQTEAKLAGILKDNPDLLALDLKPEGTEPLSVFRPEGLTRVDVDTISAEASALPRIGRLSVGQPRKIEPSGIVVMTFSSDVFVGGAKAATIVAIASLQGVSQSVVGLAATKEEDLWKGGLPIVFVVDASGSTIFHPDPELASTRESMIDLKIVQEWLESGTQVQSALVPFKASFNGVSHDMIGSSVTELGTLGESFNFMTDKVEEQIANLAKAAAENRELFVGTVKALAAAIDGKDKYTRGHSERVARISVAMGKRLGMGEEELDTLRMSALLHDIGKIAIDDAILKKPAALTDAEYEITKTHPQRL